MRPPELGRLRVRGGRVGALPGSLARALLPDNALRSTPGRILVVEDDPVINQAACDRLEAEGYDGLEGCPTLTPEEPPTLYPASGGRAGA